MYCDYVVVCSVKLKIYLSDGLWTEQLHNWEQTRKTKNVHEMLRMTGWLSVWTVANWAVHFISCLCSCNVPLPCIVSVDTHSPPFSSMEVTAVEFTGKRLQWRDGGEDGQECQTLQLAWNKAPSTIAFCMDNAGAFLSASSNKLLLAYDLTPCLQFSFSFNIVL